MIFAFSIFYKIVYNIFYYFQDPFNNNLSINKNWLYRFINYNKNHLCFYKYILNNMIK